MRIKNFTLMLLALLVSAVSYAQPKAFKSVAPAQMSLLQQGTSRQMKALVAAPAAAASKAAAPRKAEAVVVPEEAEVEYFELTGKYYTYTGSGWSDPKEVSRTVQVAWDGDDVYVSGLAHYATDAFVKGTFTDDNTVVFEKGQFLMNAGTEASPLNLYFAGFDGEQACDAVATYDETDNTFTFTTQVRTMSEGLAGTYAYGEDIVLVVPEGGVDLPVEAPEDLETSDWSYSGFGYWDGQENSKIVKVGFYGNEVYIQGLCDYLPEAWVKGTMEGNTITFPGYQFYGTYSGYSLYMRGLTGEEFGDGDVVFFYDKDAEKLTTEQTIFLTGFTESGSGGNFSADQDVTITKIVEMAGTPATSSFDALSFTPDGDAIGLVINVTDTEGNGLVADKLTFKLYSKDGENQESALTFSKELYTTLEEDLTEIPYNIDDDYISNKSVALLMDHASWKQIGLQTIYYGGGERHESEIAWYTITWPTSYEVPETATIESYILAALDDDEGELSGTVKVAMDGDDLYIQGVGSFIDDALAESWIKGTKDASGVYTFANGQFLGTVEYSSAYYAFLLGTDDETGDVEPVKMSYDAEAGVLTLLNNLVVNSEYTDRSYYFGYIVPGATLTKIVEKAATPANPTIGNMAFSYYGNYITFQIATVDTNGDNLVTDKLYYKFWSQDAEGQNTEVVFEAGEKIYKNLTENMTEIPYGFTDSYDFYDTQVYFNMSISSWTKVGVQAIYKGAGVTNTSEIVWRDITKPYSVSVPEELEYADYTFSGQKISRNSAVDFTQQVSLATANNMLYVSGVVPDMTIVAAAGEDNIYTIPVGQYIGTYSGKYYLFVLGYNSTDNTFENVKIQYNSETGTYTLLNDLLINANYTDVKNTLMYILAGSTLAVTSDAINGVEADANNVAGMSFNLAGQRVNDNFKGLVIKNGKKYLVK